MAHLSKKQQANIELMWTLEAKGRSVDEAMAAAILDLADRKALIMEQTEAIRHQVPESVQDTWDNVVEEFEAEAMDAESKGDEYDRWRMASHFLEAAVGHDWRKLRSYQTSYLFYR
jgi:cation transport regulator ChaB